MSKKYEYEQFRVSVPPDDPDTIEWCRNQRRDISLAIRILIHSYIDKNGTGNMWATGENANKPAPRRKKRTSSRVPKTQAVQKPIATPSQTTEPDADASELERMMNM